MTALRDSGGKTTTSYEQEDGTKVSDREHELASQLVMDIYAAGEGGWVSPWFTGDAGMLGGTRAAMYIKWRNARNTWVTSGDPACLDKLLQHVTFTNPPDACEFSGLKVWHDIDGRPHVSPAGKPLIWRACQPRSALWTVLAVFLVVIAVFLALN